MRETDRQKDAETEIKSKALKSWAQSSYPSYPEWSLTGYSLTQNMSQVFWPKFHGLSGFLMLNRNLKFIPSWNSIDSRPAWELGTGRHLWIGVTSPYLPILLIWILHLPCPFQLDMFPPYSQDSRWPCKSRLPGAPRHEAASVQWLGTGYFWWRPKLYQTFPVFHPKMLFWEAHWQRTHSWRKVSPFFMFYNLQMKNKKSQFQWSILASWQEYMSVITHTHILTDTHSDTQVVHCEMKYINWKCGCLESWIPILAPALPCWVTLGKSVHSLDPGILFQLQYTSLKKSKKLQSCQPDHSFSLKAWSWFA